MSDEVRKYIPLEKLNSNIYKLENMTFVVKVKWIDLMDASEIKKYGTRTFGSPEDDMMNANEKVVISLTIPKLLDLFRKKITFYLTDKSNEHVIYDIIHTHICEWRQYVEDSRGIKFKLDKVPYRDLKDLSEMASVLFSARDRTKDVCLEQDIIRSVLDIPDLITANDILEENGRKEKNEQENIGDIAPHLEDASVLDRIFLKRR